MNQRFQNAEIRLVSELYAENELYKAVSSIGPQLESELTAFGLCPEECFMETLELLAAVADKGDGILPEIDKLWLRKYNEYKRFDRHVGDDEIRKAVGIVFGFAILAIDSSRHPFYRRTLAYKLMQEVACHKWEGWATTLERIFDVPLPDGWFDAYIDEEPEGDDEVADFAKSLDSLQKQMPTAQINLQFVSKQYNTSCQQFMGQMNNPQFITPQQDETV